MDGLAAVTRLVEAEQALITPKSSHVAAYLAGGEGLGEYETLA